jgi:hypothetical protein
MRCHQRSIIWLSERLTLSIISTTLCPMKASVYLTKPAEMRKARLNQPRVNSEQLRFQRESFQRALDKASEDARKETFSRGPVRTTG